MYWDTLNIVLVVIAAVVVVLWVWSILDLEELFIKSIIAFFALSMLLIPAFGRTENHTNAIRDEDAKQELSTQGFSVRSVNASEKLATINVGFCAIELEMERVDDVLQLILDTDDTEPVRYTAHRAGQTGEACS